MSDAYFDSYDEDEVVKWWRGEFKIDNIQMFEEDLQAVQVKNIYIPHERPSFWRQIIRSWLLAPCMRAT